MLKITKTEIIDIIRREDYSSSTSEMTKNKRYELMAEKILILILQKQIIELELEANDMKGKFKL